MIRVAVSQKTNETVRDAILEIGSWELGPPSRTKGQNFDDLTILANGRRANNILRVGLVLADYDQYADRVPKNRRVSRNQLAAARELVLAAYDELLPGEFRVLPPVLWGVPTGGQALAIERAQRRGLKVMRLEAVDIAPGQKRYRPASHDDEKLLAAAEWVVGSDVADSYGAAPHDVMFASDVNGLATLGEKTTCLDYVWAYGPLPRLPMPFVVHTIVGEHVPAQIRERHDFYQQFGHLAVQQAD